MSFTDSLLCVVFTTLAASYAWGMRGAVIGGEKGAMLPGAFIGLILAWFSGSASVFAVTAAGLMGMTYGGIEPYGETMGFVLHKGRDDYSPVKGYTGLALKGALWFSVAGAFMGLAFSYGVYTQTEIIVFCLLIPVIQLIGYFIFNCPYNREKKKFPKIFFSKTRREEWGSNVLLLISLIVMAAIKKDYFTIILSCGGFVFGAIGWIVAIRAYVATIFPLKNGKYLFGKLYHNGLIDGWKLMEFILGAFGGFGLSLSFCLGYGYVEAYNSKAAAQGVELASERINEIAPVICIGCIAAVFVINLVSFICEEKGIKTNSFVLDRIERLFYCVFPMMFVLMGHGFASELMSGFVLVFVVVVKMIFDRFKKVNFLSLTIGAVICAASYYLLMIRDLTPFAVIIAGTLPYIAAEPLHTLLRRSENGLSVKNIFTKTSFATVYPCFVVMSCILLVMSYKIFGI